MNVFTNPGLGTSTSCCAFHNNDLSGFDDPVSANSPNVDNRNDNMLSTQLIDSSRPFPFIAVPQTLPGVSTPTPTPTSVRIATAIASRTTINVPNVIAALATNNRPSFMTNMAQPSGADGPANSMGKVVRPSVPATEATPQVQDGDDIKSRDEFRMAIVSVGRSTMWTVVTEIPLGADLVRSNPETSVVFGTQLFIGPSVIPAHAQHNNPVHGGLPPRQLALSSVVCWVRPRFNFVRSLLKKRKKACGFKELEEATSYKSSVETNEITPFVLPIPELHNPVNPIPNGDSRKECHGLLR
ncbi:hypothetical protein CPB86DRAFT_261313 [Serendipita vermifera]|nr:hypothetical protein CPB86DRAFT_261313 [Serendipita vermifera]